MTITFADGLTHCIHCAAPEDDQRKLERVEFLDPPLGWMGDFHEMETMLEYSRIGVYGNPRQN